MSHDARSLPTGIDVDLEKKYRVSTKRRGYLISYSSTYPDYAEVYFLSYLFFLFFFYADLERSLGLCKEADDTHDEEFHF